MRAFHALLVCFLALAGTFSAAGGRRPLTPQDLWAVKRVASPALSQDGRRAAFTVQTWSVPQNKATTNLWVVDIDGGEPRRLTTAQANDGAPAWSPDGTRIAFVSKRGEDEAAALYVISLQGGEAEKVLDWPFSVAAPRWLPDGSGLVVAVTVIPELAGSLSKADLAAMKQEVKRRRDSKMTAKATEDRQYRYWDHSLTDNLANRLLKVDLATRAWTDLTPTWTRLFQMSGEVAFDVAPDGRSVVLAANTTPPPYRDFINHDLYRVSLDGSGQLRNLTTDNTGGDDAPRFLPDGSGVLFLRHQRSIHDGEFARLWRHDFSTGKNTPVAPQLNLGLEAFKVVGNAVWFTAEDRGLVPLCRMGMDGTGFTVVHREGTVGDFDVRGGRLVAVKDSTSRPAELAALDPATGTAKPLTRFNDDLLAQLDLGRVEAYTFSGARNETVQGWLIFPPGYDASKTYPLVQLMHGGPHTMVRDSWSHRWNSHAFAAPGYVVSWVNRHGSTGFGEAFSTSIRNQWGDMPFEDIMKATDFLLKKLPNLDPKRMAAAGASYGGYMAAWVLGHTDRFACIIDHAGVNSSYAQYAADVPHGFPEVMGGKPWDNLEGMQRQNPMFYARNFKTPTLITHGELDYRVPYGNGLELYGVLQARGVPSRLVLFPNENHWILSPQNSIYWNWEVQTWLARYLGGKPTLENPSFAEAPR